MFDFEKLEVYQLAKGLVVDVLKQIYTHPELDGYIRDQWKRASLDILLNLSAGAAQMAATEKKQALTSSRSAVFESVAMLEVVSQLGLLTLSQAQGYYERYEKVSKMLLGMIRSHGE